MALEKQKKTHLTLCVCGPKGGGKTTLIHRLLHDTFIEAPQSEVENKPIVTLHTSLFDRKKGGIKETDITCREAVNSHLFDKRYENFLEVAYFSTKTDAILIVLDGNDLPTDKTLKTYFTLANNYNNSNIHLIVNKLDNPEIFDKAGKPKKTAKSISELLTKANVTPDSIHYISAKNNYGIEELRNQLNIPQPLTRNQQLAKNSTLSGTMIAPKAILAITVGVIAGFLGGPAVGIVAGVSAFAVASNSYINNFLAEKFKQPPHETIHEPPESKAKQESKTVSEPLKAMRHHYESPLLKKEATPSTPSSDEIKSENQNPKSSA